VHLSQRIGACVVTLAEIVPAIVRPALPLRDVPELPAQVAPDTAFLQGAFYSTDSDPARQDVALYLPTARP